MKRTIAAIGGTALAAVAALVVAGTASADPTTPPPATSSASVTGPADHLLPFFSVTTDAQRVCMAQQGLTAPQGTLTQQQRKDLSDAVMKAAAACGIEHTGKGQSAGRFAFAFARLTTDQQTCVANLQLTRPVGRLTEAERQTLLQEVAAGAQSCGIK